MADFNKPVTTDTYANVLAFINAKFSDLALGLDPANTTPTNVPTNAIRWNSANSRFEKYNGTAWAVLSTLFSFTDITASGNVTLSGGTANGVPYLNATKVLTSGSALTFNGTTTLTIDGGVTGYLVGPTGEMMIGEDTGGLYVGTGMAISPAIPIFFGSTGTTYQMWKAGGAEQMRLTSTGLGVGTSSPDVKLHLNATGTQALKITGSAGGQMLIMGNQDSGGANNPSIITAANGNWYFGHGTSWAGLGGTATYAMILDSTGGSLGIGTTPSSWSGGLKALDIGAYSSFISNGGSTQVGSNVYYNGANWIAKNTGAASLMTSNVGVFEWFSAASVAGGATVSFLQLMKLNAAGNLGLGVEPSAWGSAYKVLEFPNNGAGFLGGAFGIDNGSPFISNNTYNNGTNWLYKNTGAATLFSSRSGQFNWSVAASGTAGTAITWTTAMALDAVSKLTLTSAGPFAGLYLTGSGTFSKSVMLDNTGAAAHFGIEGSTAGGFATNTLAYSALAGTSSNTAFQVMTNSAVRQTWFNTGGVSIGNTTDPGATNLSVTGTIASGQGNVMLVQGSWHSMTSGTSHDFTGIPSWVKRITVMFQGVSTNGASNIIVQIGTSAGLKTTAYAGGISSGNNAIVTTAMSSGFLVAVTNGATATIHGEVTITNVASGIWSMSGITHHSETTTFCFAAGSVSLADVLTQLRITTVNGTDTFDAGTANIIYE